MFESLSIVGPEACLEKCYLAIYNPPRLAATFIWMSPITDLPKVVMLKKHLFPVSILSLAIAGALLAYALAEEFYFLDLPQYDGQRAGIFTPISAQVCGEASSFFSCETVSKSLYALLFGFPMALYGFLFYVLIFFLGLAYWVTRGSVQTTMATALFWSASVGLVADLVLLFISFVHIKALCPLCLFTYATTGLLFTAALLHLIARKSNPTRLIQPFQTADGPFKKNALTACIALLLLAIAGATGLAYAANHYLGQSRVRFLVAHQENEVRRIVANFILQRQESPELPALEVYGKADAPVTIIEVSDFLCPYCAITSRLIDDLIQTNPETLRVLFVNFPLDRRCNPNIRAAMHQGACELAMGAICAAAQEKLQLYQSKAFAARKPNFTKEDFARIAPQAGLNQAAFDQCLRTPLTVKTLQMQIEAAQSHEINATPTLFINGKQYLGTIYKEALQQIIDWEVDRLKAQE
jgi:protein-disulfide isomerase/uncharacterized membrane protein